MHDFKMLDRALVPSQR
jgi:hypothetical protein